MSIRRRLLDWMVGVLRCRCLSQCPVNRQRHLRLRVREAVVLVLVFLVPAILRSSAEIGMAKIVEVGSRGRRRGRSSLVVAVELQIVGGQVGLGLQVLMMVVSQLVEMRRGRSWVSVR
jgi:hypothetical protein